MRRFPLVSVLAALLTALPLLFLAGCGGGNSPTTPVVAQIVLSPKTISLNEGAVLPISATALNSSGNTIAADITFTSSNTNIATVSSGGLICGGVWDANIINCNATIGQGGVGQATITATSGGATATATVYVHLQVDQVVVTPPNGCTSMGQMVNASTSAFSTSAPGCSPAAPCNITSTVGPITLGSNNLNIVANSAGIESTYSSGTNSPTYTSGGTITGSKDQTCNLSNFTFGGSSGIDPTYSPATNSPTYTSGGTITGSTGQTCSLSGFNGVTGATASVTLTGPNSIASGTRLIVTASGSGATTAPTTATLSNGTATCSGTATVVTTLITVGGSGLGVVGATATVALTGTNTIASGTHLAVTASGYGATVAPTTASLSNGSATCSGTANVITALNSAGVFTAQNPGSTTIFGTVSGVIGVGVPYLTCPVVSIMVHDANSANTSFTLGTGGTQPLSADVLDTTGKAIKPTLNWASSVPAAITVAAGTAGTNLATITGMAGGTASVTATCSNPNCNVNLPAQYSMNVVTATVTGLDTTNVYAASTNSTTLVPISTSTNTAGTAITLPYLPNSIVMSPNGANVYLGSSSGLMLVNTLNSAVTTLPIPGTIVAIAVDGSYMLLSSSVANAVYYYSLATGTNAATLGGYTTSSGSYTPDSQSNAWVSANQLAVGTPLQFSNFISLPNTANALAISAQGGLTYVTGSNPNQVDVFSTCDYTPVQTLSANGPTLVQPIPNGTGAVATDSPALDVVSTPATLTTLGCPIKDQSGISSFDMGVGNFAARQLFFSTDSTRAWIISDLPELLTFVLPSSPQKPIPYAGLNVTAYSGGITLDGQQVYVGASDGAVHRIDVASASDVQQIAVGLKDANGNPVPPNLVAVQP